MQTQNQRIERIVERVQSVPPLPAAAQKLCRLSQNLNTGIGEMAQIISEDASLTAKILRIANSAFYGLSHRISTVSQAIVIIGFHGVRDLALSAAVFSSFKNKGERVAIIAEEFWRHSLATAIAARMIAQRLRPKNTEEVFTAGLLHDIGKLIFLEHFADEYSEILSRSAASPQYLHVLEMEAFGVDHAFVGGKLCQHWRIPEILSSSIAGHHSYGTLSGKIADEVQMLHMVQAGNNLAKIAVIGGAGDYHVESDFLRAVEEGEGVMSEQLRQIVLILPHEVWKVEQVFDLSSSHTNAPVVGEVAAMPVYVLISDKSDREFVELALLHLGYTPVMPDNMQSDDDNPAGVVCDAHISGEIRTIFKLRGIPVLDFAQWKSNDVASSQSSMHMAHLHLWLKKKLPFGQIDVSKIGASEEGE